MTDLTGKRFGRFTVNGSAGKNKWGSPQWLCICDCGAKRLVRAYALIHGDAKSCGCFRRERLVSMRKTHGMTGTRVHNIWAGMRKRCEHPDNPGFMYYGGRGIKVCDKWKTFEGFFEDMGNPPSGMTLERKDNNGDYSKENCLWASKKTQARNRRNNRCLNFRGQNLTLVEWSEKLRIKYTTIRARLERGWSNEKTLATGVATQYRHGK